MNGNQGRKCMRQIDQDGEKGGERERGIITRNIEKLNDRYGE